MPKPKKKQAPKQAPKAQKAPEHKPEVVAESAPHPDHVPGAPQTTLNLTLELPPYDVRVNESGVRSVHWNPKHNDMLRRQLGEQISRQLFGTSLQEVGWACIFPVSFLDK